MPISVSGNSPFQLPANKRVEFGPVHFEHTGPADRFDIGDAPGPLGIAWVSGSKLHILPAAGRGDHFAPTKQPMVLLNCNVDRNSRAVDRGLRDLETLRETFLLQALTTTSISGCAASVAGAAGAGALKGLATGPKGALIGGLIGAGLNAAELVRRRRYNQTTEETLRYFDRIFKLYDKVRGGALTSTEVVTYMLELDHDAENVGPAARAAFSELAILFADFDDLVLEQLMRDFHVATHRKALVENRS